MCAAKVARTKETDLVCQPSPSNRCATILGLAPKNLRVIASQEILAGKDRLFELLDIFGPSSYTFLQHDLLHACRDRSLFTGLVRYMSMCMCMYDSLLVSRQGHQRLLCRMVSSSRSIYAWWIGSAFSGPHMSVGWLTVPEHWHHEQPYDLILNLRFSSFLQKLYPAPNVSPSCMKNMCGVQSLAMWVCAWSAWSSPSLFYFSRCIY